MQDHRDIVSAGSIALGVDLGRIGGETTDTIVPHVLPVARATFEKRGNSITLLGKDFGPTLNFWPSTRKHDSWCIRIEVGTQARGNDSSVSVRKVVLESAAYDIVDLVPRVALALPKLGHGWIPVAG